MLEIKNMNNTPKPKYTLLRSFICKLPPQKNIKKYKNYGNLLNYTPQALSIHATTRRRNKKNLPPWRFLSLFAKIKNGYVLLTIP